MPGRAAGGDRGLGAPGAWLRDGDGLLHHPALQRAWTAADYPRGRRVPDGVDGLASLDDVSWRAGSLAVEVLQGDLTEQDVDAIVNAANNDLELGGGVAGGIARPGGPAIQAECHAIGPVEGGGAAITGGGQLQAPLVLHAARIRFGGRTSAR